MAKNRNDKASASKEDMLKVKTNEDFNKQIPNSNDPNQIKGTKGSAQDKRRN